MADDAGATAAKRLVELINTRHCSDGDDILADERASAWLRGWLSADSRHAAEPIDPERLAELQTLREGLRQLAAVNNGQERDDETLRRAASALRAVSVTMELGDDKSAPLLVAPVDTDTVGKAIVILAQLYFTARANSAWLRVKACAAPDCRWAYLDTSRNRSRRWCDMTDCGNRAKNRAWRQRRAVTELALVHRHHR